MTDERGSVVGWTLVLPVLVLVVFFGLVYLHLGEIRAVVASCAREGARYYGTWCDNPNREAGMDDAKARTMTRMRVFYSLQERGLVSPEAVYPMAPGRFDAINDLRLIDDGTWIRCELTYHFPNPLPRLTVADWWPSSFTIQAAGAARHEIGN
ncbi:MAG: hypothetical protein QME76_07175 [Bacillota bacterium]|nr:hypothetical protein [Bacillota bacterium]